MNFLAMDKRSRILIVDDDEDILELLSYNFDKEGYSVKTLSSSAEAVTTAREFKPHLIILDLLMYPFNGIEVCRMIRSQEEFKNVYIFFLTAKSEEFHQDTAFNVGGDDFVQKIVGIKPLISKVRSVLKYDFVIKKRLMTMKIDCFEFYRGLDCVYMNGRKIILNKNEFDILFFLAQNPGKKISLGQLIQSLWGSKTFMDESTVKTFIDNVRRKIGRDFIAEKQINLFQFKIEKSG
jgi:two-component system alkaline phosphatase synthesis response regulator PhoP